MSGSDLQGLQGSAYLKELDRRIFGAQPLSLLDGRVLRRSFPAPSYNPKACSHPKAAPSYALPMVTVQPDSRVQPCTIPTLRSPSVLKALRTANDHAQRQAVLQAAKVQEAARREACKAAIAALEAFLTGLQRQDKPQPATRLQALEARYSQYRQARREAAAVMTYLPHDGRPPMVGTVQGTAANAQEVRGAVRWLQSWNGRGLKAAAGLAALMSATGIQVPDCPFKPVTIKPDGSRSPFTPKAKDRKGTRRSQLGTFKLEAEVQRLAPIVGTFTAADLD